MSLRPVLFAAITLAFTQLALAADPGTVSGTVTVNKDVVPMKYAFALHDEDSWKVIISSRAISRGVLGDRTRFEDAAKSGDFVAIRLEFDAKKELESAELWSKAMGQSPMPLSAADVLAESATFSGDRVEGRLKSSRSQEFFSDSADVDLRFSATIGEGHFGANPAAATELAAGRPALADGAATGSIEIDGVTVKLTHVLARLKPNPFDSTKKDVIVLVSDRLVPRDTFMDSMALQKMAADGSTSGVLITIDQATESATRAVIFHKDRPFQLSGSGFFLLDMTDLSDRHVSGRFFTKEEEDFFGKNKYSYDLTFATAIDHTVPISELTLDASSGTKLPADGGEPGKAYMAFDKAVRAGNIKEMSKFRSKTKPMPAASEEEQKRMLSFLQSMRATNLHVVGGFATADHATLMVEGQEAESKARETGTIEMVREEGTWKLLGESWKHTSS